MKQSNQVLHAKPERRGGCAQRVFTWERRSGGSTRDEAMEGTR